MKPSLSLSQVKILLHYFGWDYTNTANGTWEFWHKSLNGNYCGITPKFGTLFIGHIEFYSINNEKVLKQDSAKVKGWNGLFTAVRNHTRSLLFRNEVMNQQLKNAA